jgi:radical SAM enzyme (TIGR01210 family)
MNSNEHGRGGASSRRRRPANDEPAAAWRESEVVEGVPVDAGVVILRTTGCSHFHAGGCSMCGYNVESSGDISPKDIAGQFSKAVDRLGDVKVLKVYTSGSFLDASEVPAEVAASVLDHCHQRQIRLLFESRPEYVSEDAMAAATERHEDLEVAIGLESANDRVLRYSVNKGFTFSDYEKAATNIARAGARVRTYLLLKPPFLTEAEAMEDAIASARKVDHLSDTISINPVNVQKRTLVERLWKQWAYRPPWLWSVLHVLGEISTLDARIVCDPAGGGKERGAHNCGGCDGAALEAVRRFSMSQDPADLDVPPCSCRDLWEKVTSMEGYVTGGTCDLQRFSRPRP